MFIGRDEIVDTIRQHDPAEPLVADIRGELGTGRTQLLEHLLQQDPRSIFVDLDEFNPDHPGQVGDKASVGAVQANFTEYSRLLLRLISHVDPEGAASERMRQRIQGVKNDEIYAGRIVSLQASLDELSAPLEPRMLADAWRSAADAITETFLELWEGHASDCLLLLDNFDSAADQEIGNWLTGLLHKRDQHAQAVEPLARPIVVLTRSPASAPSDLPGEHVRPLVLSNLSKDEVGKFITGYRGTEGYRGAEEVGEDTLELICGVSDGHPATLRLVCDLLWGGALAAPGSSPEELLRDLPLPREERAAALVERLVERLDAPGLMDAIEAAAVPRSFDAELLSALLVQESPGGDDGPPQGALAEGRHADKSLRDHFERIRELPFTEVARDGGFRIHEYVRASILARMELLQKRRLRDLHERAESYYEKRLLEDSEDEHGRAREYGDWFFLESPRWQNRKREWLYHMSRLEDSKKRRGALLEATRLFLDTFWWWGNYVHFDFCDRLVADLDHLVRQLASDGPRSSARVQASVELGEWRRKLGTLHRGLEDVLVNYPLRSQKPARANWSLVRDALTKIRRTCDLERLPERPSKRQRHIYALLNVFFAHTWRYGAKASQDAETYFRRADERYEDAYGRFKDNRDGWNQAWVAFERADLHLERARRQKPPDDNALMQALRLSEDSADDLARPTPGPSAPSAPTEDTDTEVESESFAAEPDHELISNLHRLRGDIHLLQGSTEQAAGCYGRAVLHSYLFHLTGGLPDEYTLQFYVDIRARALEFLDSIWRQGRQDDAVACATRMWREAWRTDMDDVPALDEAGIRTLMPGIKAHTALGLALLLFPRGPDIEEIGADDSEFIDQYGRFKGGLDPAVYSDLHEAV